MRRFVACLALASAASLPAGAFAQSTAVLIAPYDFTVQGDGATLLLVKITNNGTLPVNQVTFTFSNASKLNMSDLALYTAPTGWHNTNIGNTNDAFQANAAADDIPVGGSLIFELYVTGQNDGPIPAARTDVTDQFASIVLRDTSGANTTIASPTWTRHGLKLTLDVAPTSVAIGGSATLQYRVENRSTQTQTAIVSNPLAPATLPAGAVTGPAGTTPASVASVASGASGALSYTATANGSQSFFQFQASVQNGTAATTSPTVLSTPVAVGRMTALLSVSPNRGVSGDTVTVTLTVQNTGPTALGNVIPSQSPSMRSALTDPISVGTATVTKSSGPTPAMVPSIAPGGSAQFSWGYTVTGANDQTYQFQDGAVANGFASNLATSNAGLLGGLALVSNPSSAPGGVGGGATTSLTFTLENMSGLTINEPLQFTFPAGFVASSAPAPSGFTSAITAGGTVVTYTPTGGGIASGSRVPFPITFSGTPTPPSGADTAYSIPCILTNSGNDVDTSVLVTADRLTLTSVPSPATVPADGNSTIGLSAKLVTAGGTAVQGATVSFSATQGALSQGSATTDVNGNASVVLTAPASTTTLSGTANASWFSATGSVATTFTGVSGPIVLYVGGTLYPRQVAPNTSVSVSVGMTNVGGSSITLPAANPVTFQFSDGLGHTFQTTFAGSITLPPDGTTHTLTFPATLVPAAMAAGSYYPSFADPVAITDPVAVTGSPTFADLVALSVEPSGEDGALLSWSTDLEVENAGFRVLRAKDAEEPVALEGAWVPATGSFSSYQYADGPLTEGVWSYWVEDVDLSGTATVHGPVVIEVGAAQAAAGGTTTAASGAGSGEPGLRGSRAGSLWDDPAQPADLRILEEDSTGVTWEITPPGYSDARIPFPVALHDRLRIPGYAWLAVAGEPDLPVEAIPLEVPAHATARITLRDLEETTVEGLDPTVVPGIPSALASGELGIPDGFHFPSAGNSLSTFPELPTTLVTRGTSGEAPVSTVVVTPLRWEPDAGLLHVATRMVVRIDFLPAPPVVYPPLSPAEAAQHRILTGPSLKVAVTGADLVRVPLAALSAAGVDSTTAQVYRSGLPVASRVDGGALLFPSAPVQAPLSGWQAYWVAPRGNEPAAALPLSAGAAPTPAPAPSLALRQGHYQQSLVYGLLAAQGQGDDRWYWSELKSSGPTSSSLALGVPGVPDAGSPATLTLLFQGMYDDPDAPGVAHTAEVALNGVDLGPVTVVGYGRATVSFPVPAATLLAGANNLTLTLAPAPIADLALESADLSWTGPADALGSGELLLTALADGPLTAGGFSQPPAWVLDQTAATLLPVASAPDGAGGYLASVSAASGHALRFVTAAAPVAASWAPRAPGSALDRLAPSGVDELVVAASDLAGASRAFADYRSGPAGGRLRTAVVDVAEVYDEAAFGDVAPLALRRFLEMGLTRWPAPGARYLLLVGDSTYDPLGHLGPASTSGLLLAERVDTALLEAPSDTTLAFLGGSPFPALAVGRLPARTPQEVADLLAKTVAYEAAPRDGWDARETLLADDLLPDFDAALAATVPYLPPGVTADALSSSELGASVARASLLQTLGAGEAAVTYFGHGGVQVWGGEPFLATSDLPSLANSRTPVMLAVDCLNAYFDHPQAQSLGEELVRAPSGGAVAFWGSSAITEDTAHRDLALAFHHAFWREPGLRLGEVVDRALSAVAWRDDSADLLASFVLLGDPALKPNVNSPPVARARLVSVRGSSAAVADDGSFDPDGDPLLFHWTVASAPAGSRAYLVGASGSQATLSADLPGLYVVRLQVADGKVAGPPADVAVQIGTGSPAGGGGCQVGGQTGGQVGGRPGPGGLLALALLPLLLLTRRLRPTAQPGRGSSRPTALRRTR